MKAIRLCDLAVGAIARFHAAHLDPEALNHLQNLGFTKSSQGPAVQGRGTVHRAGTLDAHRAVPVGRRLHLRHSRNATHALTMAAPVLASPTSDPAATSPVRVALVGNPNTGKTTLFNRLCGAKAKTSNFPGTTTAVRTGRSVIGQSRHMDVVDLPGLYGLTSSGPEARIVSDVLRGGAMPRPDAVVVLADATNLARNLVIVGELLARDETVVVALNMVDLARRRGLTIDATQLAARVGVPVVPMVASKGQGLDAVRTAIEKAISAQHGRVRPADLPDHDLTIETLTNWADSVASEVVEGAASGASHIDARTERLDRILTHPVLGMAVFLAVMGGLFWSLFALAALPMDLIEATFAAAWRAGEPVPAARSRPRVDFRRDHRRHCRHRGVSAADLPVVFPDQPARGHGLPRPRGVRERPVLPPVRPAWTGIRAAAHVARLRVAGHHERAADSRSPRSPGHYPHRSVHELLSAAAGLRIADQLAVRGSAGAGGRRIRRLLSAWRHGGVRQRAGLWQDRAEGTSTTRWCSSCPPTRCHRSRTHCSQPRIRGSRF